MADLVFFEYILDKFCLNFLTLILSASPNMMHNVRTSYIVHAWDVRHIAIEEVWNYRKIEGLQIKNTFESGWWVDAYSSTCLPSSTPGISYKNYHKSLAYLSNCHQ